MYKKAFLLKVIWVGLIFFPFYANAQAGKGSKFLRQFRTFGDSGISSIPKKTLQQLNTVPANGSQRLILMGAPGVTKQASVLWLAKKRNKEAYRVDLSEVVSKYIGETEKNLALIFDDTRATDNILFFDNGDELFAHRTGVRDSHDKYANQEITYFLSRIENYQGLVVLATNYKANIDPAFLRRFKYVIITDN